MLRKFSSVLLALGLATLSLTPHPAHAQFAQAAQKPVLTTLHRFDGTHGANPQSTATLGRDGNVYGTTPYGGVNNAGSVFRITPEGTFTTLFNFNRHNGQNPFASLVQGTDDAFYGTTNSGGKYGRGIVFRITADGVFSTVYAFNGTTDGRYPYATLTLAPDGSLYGMTSFDLGISPPAYATVFHLTLSGTLTTLYRFTQNEGQTAGPLAIGPDGALYGTTAEGGQNRQGALFRLAANGQFSVLHDFTNSTGSYPVTGLTPGTDGAFYGTAPGGGGSKYGVLYKITTAGQYTLLHEFSVGDHGAYPYAALTLGADGNFYGTTELGDTDDQGTVFQMTPTGHVTTLYKFHTKFDGRTLFAGVVSGLDGALYGMTLKGGPGNYGTIYKLTLPQ